MQPSSANCASSGPSTERIEPCPEEESAARTSVGPVQGYVDTHNPSNSLGGWAIQQGNPELLRIQVLGPEGLLGEGTAGLYREFPAGNCGFAIALSRPIAASDLVDKNRTIYAIDPH